MNPFSALRVARRRRGRGERGAVAVEFALLLPLLAVLTFGLIEFSSAYHDKSALADAARSGARIGSAEPITSSYATDVASAVDAAVTSLPSDSPQELWVYKANAAGYPGSSSSFTSCSTDCIKYTWNKGSKSFGSPQGGWPASSHQVCTQPYDEIGVYLKAKHHFVTGFFGADMALTDHAVFRLEPVAASNCAS